MPQAQYGFTAGEFISAKAAIEKRIGDKAYFNLSFEQNFNNNLKMAEVGFRYNFNFAQAGATIRQSNRNTSFIEYARGSLLYDRKTKFLGADNQYNVGKGGITVIPFLDLNANGLRDEGEPKAYGLNLRANGGRILKNDRDTTIMILGLEPYTNCYIELDENSFENISWRMPVKILGVAVDPDILKHIEVPVTVVGEASGKVLLAKEGESNGLGRIIVSFFNSQNKLVTSTLTEEDGYYSWFGLVPGKYSVRIDTAQLRKIKMTVEPPLREFSIGAGAEGDMAEGLDFTLSQIADTARKIVETPVIQPVIRKDTSFMIIHEITQELITISKDSWAIQLGAFRNKANADNLRRKLERILGRKVEVIIEDNYYKVRINEIETREDVDKIIEILKRNGITELWVIGLKARQQQVVLRQVQDSIMTVSEMKYFSIFGDDFYKLDAGKEPVVSTDLLDMMNLLPDLKHPGITDPRLIGKPIEEPAAEVMRVIPVQKILNIIELPDMSAPQPEPMLVKMKAGARPASRVENEVKAAAVTAKPAEIATVARPEPAFAIQVAVFYKKAEALRAQRKITSKLNLQVEIIEQWEFYRVIIPGFYTREETYKYYPELAGLGYPGVSVIERK
jgi:cell division protein FtsN